MRNALQAKHDTEQQEPDLSAHALAVAVVAARRASKLIQESVAGIGDLEWVEKASADFVTEVDRGAEAAITKAVRLEFPDAVIIGEELTPETVTSDDVLTFIVDPLDGTTNFLHGFPHYAVSIGVMHKTELIAAVVQNVPRGDIFTARAGYGTKLNDKPVTVSSIDSTSRALIGTGFPFKNLDLLDAYARQFVEVTRYASGIRRAGSAALDLADVACGRFDGFWELSARTVGCRRGDSSRPRSRRHRHRHRRSPRAGCAGADRRGQSRHSPVAAETVQAAADTE